MKHEDFDNVLELSKKLSAALDGQPVADCITALSMCLSASVGKHAEGDLSVLDDIFVAIRKGAQIVDRAQAHGPPVGQA